MVWVYPGVWMAGTPDPRGDTLTVLPALRVEGRGFLSDDDDLRAALQRGVLPEIAQSRISTPLRSTSFCIF